MEDYTLATHICNLGVISGPTRHRYLEQLKDVLGWCLDHEVTKPFRDFCKRWIDKGAPIDPKILYIPKASMKVVLRQVVTALPTMSRHHADARLWLKSGQFRPVWCDPLTGQKAYPAQLMIGGKHRVQYEKPYEETFIPFNLLLYAPRHTAYAQFNKVGFTLAAYDESEVAAS